MNHYIICVAACACVILGLVTSLMDLVYTRTYLGALKVKKYHLL